MYSKVVGIDISFNCKLKLYTLACTINQIAMILKQILKNILLLFISLYFLSSCKQKEIKCTIKGDIFGRDSKALLLCKTTGDFRVGNIKIPIINNSFEYEINAMHPEVYELIFEEEYERGSFMSNIFFAEDGVINFTLYEEENESNNIIEGGFLNNELKSYNNILDNKFWSIINKYNDSLDLLDEERFKLFGQLDNPPEKKTVNIGEEKNPPTFTARMILDKSAEYKAEIDSLRDEIMYWDFNYINEHTSLISYYLFVRDLQIHSRWCCWTEGDTLLLNNSESNFHKLSAKYPDHPYTLIVGDLLKGLKNIHKGGKFIDFSASDMNQETVYLSHIIKTNKVVLLDLWSIWCGPCIEKSNEMLPVYAEFKDKGFEIVGVARGDGDKNKLVKFVENKNYPWINLIDFKNENNIWEKYSLSNRGGKTFLITSSGKIIAIDPNAYEVRQELIELLK